jgi:hypothetical protein
MFPFMSMIFTLIQIKFDIDVNDDEWLETIWENIKKKKKLFAIGSMKSRTKLKLIILTLCLKILGLRKSTF